MLKILLSSALVSLSFIVLAEHANFNNQEMQLFSDTITANYCTCGCNKTILNCLNTDPSCATAPELAKSVIAQIVNSRVRPMPGTTPGATQEPQNFIYNYDGGGGVVGGRDSQGRDCMIVSIPGGTSMESCK